MLKHSNQIRVMGKCLSYLEGDGFSIEETDEYGRAVATLLEIGKSYLTPNMSPEFNDFTADNCYWLLLKFNGAVIGGIAARRDRLGERSLGDFLKAAMKRQYGAGKDEQIVSVAETLEKDVRGDITYFGDLLVTPDFRNQGDHLRLFTMYCHMHASVYWNSDWQYSFIPEKRAENGGAFTYGFSTVIPGAQEWVTPAPANRSSSECCVLSSRHQVNDLARYYARSPNKLRKVQDAN